jgi:hypothetical protein
MFMASKSIASFTQTIVSKVTRPVWIIGVAAAM